MSSESRDPAHAAVTIRRAVPGDARALAEFARRVFHATFAADNRPEDMAIYLPQAFGPAIQLAEIIHPDLHTLLAIARGADERGDGGAGKGNGPRKGGDDADVRARAAGGDERGDGAGVLAGYAQLQRDDAPECVRGPVPVGIKRLYVDHCWHGRDVANRLMEASLDAARAWGGRTLWLGVWEHNPRAIAFYRKWGFQHIGEHRFQFGQDTQSDWVMARTLDEGRAGTVD